MSKVHIAKHRGWWAVFSARCGPPLGTAFPRWADAAYFAAQVRKYLQVA